jgi:hypothetical protein
MLVLGTFSQVWKAARTAANSLPLEICDSPFSLIQYEIGIENHVGVWPSDNVIRVYAAAVAQQTNVRKQRA